MKQFYFLVAGLSLVFFWFTPKENKDSTTALSYSKKHEPTPKKLNVRVRNKNSKEPDILAISLNQNWQSPLAANVTVLKSVAVQGGGNAILGGQLNYTIEVSNTASGVANNATGVTVNDILNANLTLVSGSLKATPIIVEDSYDCIGNVGITVPANAGLLANDIDPLNLTIQATVINQAGTQGTVVANPDGSFSFTPNVGYTGTTTFTYTASNGNFARTATVSIVVSAPIWFVNVAAAANGNGTLASPFKDWSNFATANALTGTSDPAANQTIFVYSGTYSGAATLKAGQKVLGRGATVGLAGFAGATVQTYTNALPSTSGTRPNLTSSGTTITLASDNTLRGFDMGNSTKDIVGSSFGTLTTSEMALTGNGAALDLSTGTLAASFTNISSTNAASDAISLSSILGNLTNSGSTTITNPTGRGISIFSNSSLVSSFGNTTINGSAQTGLSITSSNSSISTTFGSLDVAPDAGQSSIQLSSNAGTVICTSGTLTSSNATLTVGISGANSSNKINLNMTLTAISASGGQKGISIKDATGSFTVTGVGTVIGSGGSLSNLTQKGIELDNASNITLRNMAFNNVSTTDETLSASDFSVSNGGIVAKDVSSLTLNNLSIAGSSQRGIAGHNVSNFSMTGCTIFSSGDNINEGAIAFTNLSGTCSISGSSITRANEHLISIHNTSVNLNITISNSTISDTQTNPSGTASLIVGTGILANTFGTGKTYITVSNCTLNKIGADGLKLINNDNSTGSYEITGCTIDPVNTVTQPNDVGTAMEITSNETSTIYANIHDNTRFSANGGNVVTIAPTEQSTIHAKFTNNTITYKSGGISGLFRGIEVFGQDDARGYATITGNNISGLPQSNGIMVDNRSTLPTNIGNGRIDAIITGNTVNLNYPDPNSTGRTIFLEAGNVSTSKSIVCGRVASNTTTTNGINGHFRLSSNGTNSAILLEGTTDAATAWNSNSNTPSTGSGGVVSVRSGSVVTMVATNTCIAPSTPPAFASLLADNKQFADVKDGENRVVYENFEGKKEELVKSELLSKVDPAPAKTEVIKTNYEEETQNSITETFAGETITVAGAGSGFVLPAGKSTTITFSATISNTPSSCTIPNTASVSGSNFSTVNSSTSTNIVIPPPTSVTTSAGICNGQSISLSATCASGIVQWYNLATPSTLLGTSNSGESFSQSPSSNTTYQAACKVNGCESARTNSGLITVNPLPSISVGVSSSICAGATSFIIPYSSPSNSPNTYSISGTGITTVTEGALLANTIIVNLSSPATGSTYSYSLTVKNANGCVSTNITGSVEVNAVPTINIESSTPICAGSNSFTIPYTSTSGSPKTYSISGTGITTVTNGALTSSPIIVNLSAGASGSSISYTLTVRNAGGCTSSNVNGSVTVNPLPTLTTSASPTICAGATTFTIPYTGTTNTPTSYSISGTGITTVTDAVLPLTPITVNLSSGASGSSISYTLTVKNVNGCTSNNINGSVTVNPLPTITTSASPAICSGATTFNIPYTATTGTPTLYSVSGVDITTVTDAPLPGSSPITVNLSSGASGSSISYILIVRNANGCLSNNVSGSVTVNSTPAPTSPTATPSNRTTVGSVTLSATGCSSGTLTWYDATTNVAVPSPNNQPNFTSSGTFNFYAKCTGTNTCMSDASVNVSVSVSLCTPLASSPGNVNITWTGILGTDWNTACNWTPAWVPDLTTGKVIIPNTVNKPVISSAIPDIKSIEIQSSALLTINTGNNLNVRGDGGLSKGFTIAGGTVTNNGTINIESATNTAIPAYIYLQASNSILTNNGTIKVNSTDEAIGVGLAISPATITNSLNGIINIVNGIGVEIALVSDALNFSNAGTINYDGSVLAFKFLGTTNFTNTGTVNINSGTGIENPAGNTIANNSCGKIFITSGTYTNGGTTTNAGLIQMPNNYGFTNTGTFTNNGVLKANAVSAITNGKMVITNACPIFTLGGSNNYTVSGIFSDAGATTSAGTYTSVGNKFTANNIIPTGTQTLYAQVTDGTCTFVVPFDFNNVKPTAVSVNNTSVCPGESVTLSATCPSGTPTWYTAATGGSNIGTGTSLSNSPTVTTTYYATCETTNCVSGRVATNAVTVNTIPNVPTNVTVDKTTVCSGSSVILNANCSGMMSFPVYDDGTVNSSKQANNLSSVQLIWYTQAIGGVAIGSGTSFTHTPSGNTTYYAACSENSCESSRVSTTAVQVVSSFPDPTNVSVNNTAICNSGSITLSATCAVGTVTWYNVSSGGTTIGNGNSFSHTVSTTTTYYASCEGGNCVSNRIATNAVIVSNTTISCNAPITTDATTNCGAVITYNPPVVVSCNVAGTLTNTYDYTGSTVDWTVPSGVTSINIKAWGAQGGANWVNNTNFGGYSEGTLSVTPGEVLKINVGGQPTTTAGGWNGGGAGEGGGKGGGGASDVRRGGSLLTHRQIVASGGGGAGYWSNLHVVGGEGGGLTGGNGFRFPDFGTNPGGKGASQTAGGADGTCVNFNVVAMAGSLGQGGSPSGCGCEGYGGGGGYYGGAGSGNCRGGGGGSGYIGGVSSGSMQSGIQIGNGKIEIAYQSASAPTITQTSGLSSGSTFPVGTTTNTFEVNDNGYTTSCSFDVTVNAVSTSISYNNSSYCVPTVPTTASVTRTGLVGGVFSSSPAGLSINSSTGNIDLMSSLPGTYTISYGFASCTQAAATTTVIIKATPSAPTITPPTTLVVCSPTTLTLTASGCAGTVTWSQGAGTGTSLTISAVGTYSISATCTVNSCTSDASTTVTGLEIKAKPAAPTIITPTSLSVCSPSTLTLTASGCAGSVTWSEGAATGESLTISAVGTYNISATCTVNGCTSDASLPVTGLEIKAKPTTPTITPPASLSVCSPSTLTLTASGCAGTVTWSQGAATGTSLTISAVGTYSISATCTVNGCTSDASLPVTGLEIKAKPAAPTITPPSSLSVCSPSTLTLTASGCVGDGYLV